MTDNLALNQNVTTALRNLDTFLIRQEVEEFETISNVETSNSYIVLGAANQSVRVRYVVVEDSSFISRWFLGNKRPFTLKVVSVPLNDMNATGRDEFTGNAVNQRLLNLPAVFTIERPWRCWAQQIIVKDGTGRLLGTVTQDLCQCFTRNFTIRDHNSCPVLRAHQGMSVMSFLGISPRWNWELRDLREGIGSSNTIVGDLRKQWAGLMQELLTDADNFNVTFHNELNAQLKVLVLAAVFLIDFMYFEDNDRNSRRRKTRSCYGKRGGALSSVFNWNSY